MRIYVFRFFAGKSDRSSDLIFGFRENLSSSFAEQGKTPAAKKRARRSNLRETGSPVIIIVRAAEAFRRPPFLCPYDIQCMQAERMTRRGK